ncbi:lysophosphatidic acid receptor 6 isoform X2 [Genypterus blacodes]|uniref:lysophosphatidic acid receptor 6 isoform X2 n=1 Tax=Genypterus blacodes TaxID=154954 RepID=UPI003F775D67
MWQVNLSTSSCHNVTSDPPSSYVFISVYSFIFIMGLILNVKALVVFFRQTKTRSHTTVYMINLAIADLLLVLTLPVRVSYLLGYTRLPQRLCDWLGLTLLVNMYSSIFLLTCICFDRCVAVTFPMSHRVKEGRKKAPLVCLAVWVITFGSSLPIFLLKSKVVQESHCFRNQPVYATWPVVLFTTLSFGFGIPLVLMLICSWGLVRAVLNSTVAQTNLVDSGKIQRMRGCPLLLAGCVPLQPDGGVSQHHTGSHRLLLHHRNVQEECGHGSSEEDVPAEQSKFPGG